MRKAEFNSTRRKEEIEASRGKEERKELKPDEPFHSVDVTRGLQTQRASHTNGLSKSIDATAGSKFDRGILNVLNGLSTHNFDKGEQ